MKNLKIVFTVLVIFFVLTRVVKIAEVPSSLYWDEASIAVNAYSLISDSGKDEWGDFLPIHFRAFGEFKLPVFVYSTAITSLLFGLSEYSVRLTSVMYSLGCVFLVGFLGFYITGKKYAGVLAAFLMTISPWFFIFSRTGYEAVAGLFFYLAGITSMLLFRRRGYLFILLATLCFMLAMYSYNSYRLLSPLTLFGFLLINFNRKNFKKYMAVGILSLFLFGVSLVPIIRLYLFDSGFGRAQVFTLFPTVRRVYDAQGGAHLQFIYNRDTKPDWRKNYTGILTNYLSHFSPNFLFISGDKNARSHAPGLGQLYFIDLIFLLFTAYVIFKKRDKKLILFLGLLLLSILPASLFMEAPHALRSLTAAPFFVLLISFGLFKLLTINKKIGFLVILLYLILFGNYCQNFIRNYNTTYAVDWQQGYKEIFTSQKGDFSKYDSIVVTNQLSQPYIFGLFYLKYPIEDFRKEVGYSPYEDWGFSTVNKFNKFNFMKVKKESLPKGKSLVFTSSNDKLNDMQPIKVIKVGLKESDWIFVYEYENK